MSQLGLRKQSSLGFTQDVLDASDAAFVADMQRMEAESSNPITRGFESAGLGMRGNALYGQANEEEIAGNYQRAQQLELAARDAQQRAQVWAPTTREFTDIDGPGAALDWVGGQIGNLHTSLPPVVGGLAGAAVGLGVGALTKNPALAMRIGAGVGSMGMAVPMERDEAISQGMQDAAIRNSRSAQEIRDAANIKGVLAGAAESVVPFGVTNSLLLGGGKKLATELAQQGAAKVIGKRMLIDGGEEFLTEGAQALIGQGAQNYLRRDELTDFNYKDAFNEGMAGFVGGSVMGGVGGAAEVARAGIDSGVDKVRDVAADPLGAVLDAGVNLAGKAGTLASKVQNAGADYLDRKLSGKTKDEQTRELVDELLPSKKPSITDPLREEEKSLDPVELDTQRNASAVEEAVNILKSPQGMHPKAVREAALEFANKEITWDEFRARKSSAEAEQGRRKKSDGLLNAIAGEDVFGGDDELRGLETKKSMMRPYEGDTFEYEAGKSPEITATGAPSKPFKYDAVQRSAAIEKAKAQLDPKLAESKATQAVLEDILLIRHLKSVNSAATAEETTKAAKTASLVDVLVNRGYAFADYDAEMGRKILSTAVDSTEKIAHARQIAGLITWMRQDYKRAAEVIPATLKVYGDNVVKLLDKAYEAAVQEGIVDRDDAKFTEIKEAFGKEGLSSKQMSDAVVANLKDSLKHRVTGDNLAELVSRLAGIAKRGMAGENVTKGGNTKSRQMDFWNARQNTDREILTTLFGDDKHIALAMGPFIEQYLAQQGSSKEGYSAEEMAELGQDESVNPDVQMTSPEKVTDHFKGDNEFYDLSDKAQRAEFNKLKAEKESRDEGGAETDRTRRTGKTLGIIDHAIEKAEAEKTAEGKVLTQASRDKIIRDLVHQLDPSIARLMGLPKNLSDVARKDYDQRRARYDKTIAQAARRLNQQHVALRLTETEMQRPALEFSKADIKALSLDRDMRTASPANGTLVFKQEGVKKPFITSAPMILRTMFQRQNQEQYLYTESNASAYTLHDLLLDGITSIITGSDKLTGEYGYVMNGEPVWVGKDAKDLPANFLVLGGSEKRKSSPRFYGEVKATSLTSREIAELREFDPDTKQDGMVERDVDTLPGKVIELSKLADKLTKDATDSANALAKAKGSGAKTEEVDALAKASENADKALAEIGPDKLTDLSISFWTMLKQYVNETEAGKRLIRESQWAFNRMTKQGAPKDELLAASAALSELLKAKVIETPAGNAKFKALVKRIEAAFDKYFPEGAQYTEQVAGKWKEEGQVGNGTLGDETPLKQLPPRNKWGLVESNNDVMVGASIGGRQVALREGKTEAGPLATKGDKQSSKRTEAKFETAPSSSRTQVELFAAYGVGSSVSLNGKLAARINKIMHLMPGLVGKMGNVVHVGVMKRMGAFEIGGRVPTAIAQPVRGGIAILLSPKFFAAEPIGQARVFAHEVAHSFETDPLVGLSENYGRSSEAFKEAEQVTDPRLKKMLTYPMGETDAELKAADTSFESEFHAQLFGVMMSAANILQEQMPKTFAMMEKLYGKEGKFDQTTARDDGGDVRRDSEVGQGAGQHRQVEGSGEQLLDRASKLPTNQKAYFLNKLKTAKPTSPRHEQAIKDALAIIAGTKEGDVYAALDKVFSSSEYLGASVAKPEATETEYNPDEYEGYAEQDLEAFEARMNEGLDERAPAEAPAAESTPAQQLQTYLEQNGGKDGAWDVAAKTALKSGDEKRIAGALAAAKKKFETPVAASSTTSASKPNAQQAKAETLTQAQRDERIAAATAALDKMLGPKIGKMFADAFADGSSGSWTAETTRNVIRIALNGNVMGTAFHESIHELFDILKKNGGGNVIATLEKAAMNPMMQKRLRRALDGHPEAIDQLATPEEAVAFMFQFWALDPSGFPLGPQTKSTFEKIKDMLAKVLAVFSEDARNYVRGLKIAEAETQMLEDILGAFKEGALANDSRFLSADRPSRGAVVSKLASAVDKHDAAMRHIGEGYTKLFNKAGQLVMSAEAVMEATNNPHVKKAISGFNQKAGEAMGSKSAFFDGVRKSMGIHMNKLENILVKYKDDLPDLELARKALQTGKVKGNHPDIQIIVDELRGFLDGMKQYIVDNGVSRYDADIIDPVTGTRGTWVKLKDSEHFIKDYWPQIWDVDMVIKNVEALQAEMIKHHSDKLEEIAKEANAEVSRKRAGGEASKQELAERKEGAAAKVITKEMVAAQIVKRLMNAQGQIDMDENVNELGITPVATAVNRRTLTWLDKEVFDKYMSKDVSRILSTYTSNIVKRGEYQSRFGPNGNVLRDSMDNAVLWELGGDALVKGAKLALPAFITDWKARKAASLDSGVEFEEPFPTLRAVGSSIHRDNNGLEAHNAAMSSTMRKLAPTFKGIQAFEGTLGADMSAGARRLSNWATTYQVFRNLSMMLFTSFQDVMGLVREGGEMKDAWAAFVSGMKEIKHSWKREKSDDAMMQRGEMWGAMDAGSYASMLGEAYSSVYMTGNAKKWSDEFFRWTGAEGWNRGIRGVAAQVAERVILEWKKDGIKPGDKAALARVERLFGKDFDVSTIALDNDGMLDITDARNQAAVTRWVLDAVPAPNAAHRPILASDPHFQVFMQLKNFTYAFHRVALKGALEQAKLGNYRPVMVLALGYIPIAIAGGAIKEMLIPGEEPPWMQGGLDDYLEYGWQRAGILGIPQMYAGHLMDVDPAAAFGPTVDQLQNLMTTPLPEMRLNLSPFEGDTQIVRGRDFVSETLGAMPGGNLLRRLGS